MKNKKFYYWNYRGLSGRLNRQGLYICLFLALLAIVLALLHIKSGTMPISYKTIWGSLTGGGENATIDRIIWRLRLPRVITALFVGGALGMAGAVFQSISRNPLGSPDILGFTTGAATGAIIQIILFNAGPWETAIAAILAGLTSSVAIFLLSIKSSQGFDIYRFILVGIGAGAFLAGVNTVLLVMGDIDQAASAQLWLSGSLNTRTPQHAYLISAIFFVVSPFVLSQARTLDLIEVGEDIALQLGAHVKKTRLICIIGAVLLTASATAVAGPIAFVALIAPQLARRLMKRATISLIGGAFMGAVLLLSADLITLYLPFNFKMPIGLMTGLLGGGYFLWFLQRKVAP